MAAASRTVRIALHKRLRGVSTDSFSERQYLDISFPKKKWPSYTKAALCHPESGHHFEDCLSERESIIVSCGLLQRPLHATMEEGAILAAATI